MYIKCLIVETLKILTVGLTIVRFRNSFNLEDGVLKPLPGFIKENTKKKDEVSSYNFLKASRRVCLELSTRGRIACLLLGALKKTELQEV